MVNVFASTDYNVVKKKRKSSSIAPISIWNKKYLLFQLAVAKVLENHQDCTLRITSIQNALYKY